MKSILVIIIFLAIGTKSWSQLPSEKPLSQVITPMMKEKLEQPKQNTNAVLPSEQKALPKAAEEAKKKQPNASVNTPPNPARLPSNKKPKGKVIMDIQKPKS